MFLHEFQCSEALHILHICHGAFLAYFFAYVCVCMHTSSHVHNCIFKFMHIQVLCTFYPPILGCCRFRDIEIPKLCPPQGKKAKNSDDYAEAEYLGVFKWPQTWC